MEVQHIFFIMSTLFILTSCNMTVSEEPSSVLEPSNDSSNISDAVNEFGHKLLLRLMKEKKNENVVLSPTGVAGLLAMALLGSVGTTYDEIAMTLGFSQDILVNRKNHEQLGEQLNSLANVSSKTVYADAIFVDDRTPLRALYRNYLYDVYRGEVQDIDFKKTEEARNIINDWVKNHTDDNIENFLKRSLPTDTKVVLLSALYFSGQWDKPFIPEYTAKMPFKTTDKEVMAELMLNFGNFRYLSHEKHDLQMVALPYNDSETVMYALKPRSHNISLLELLEKLNYSEIGNIINQMSNRKCVIRYPNMKLSSGINLENALKTMGIKSMFTPGEANFALMINGNTNVNSTDEELVKKIKDSKKEQSSIKVILDNLPSPDIHVDSVIHDVKITINEYGTEAVAASSAVLARSAELFYADSPFYMFIRNERTKLVTFSAVIFDPTV